MKKYDSYKDSGIEWIGEIPIHWEYTPVKYFAEIVNGSTPSSSEESYWKGEINWVTTDDLGKLDQKYIYNTRRTITETGYKSCGTTIAPKGSVVISTRAPIGHLGILKVNACTNQGCKTLIPKNINSEFLHYYLGIGRNELEALGQGSTFKELPTSALKGFKIIAPPISEQTIIANYLDQKTAQIDNLITKKESLIQLLEEERVALINQAVTKGLDLNVPMKDSGIEWLGEMPEHWEVKSFRFCIKILTDYTANGSFASLAENVTYYDRGYSRLVRLTDLRVNLENEGLYVDEQAHNFLKKSELFGGELLIANVGAYAGLVKQMPIKEGKHTLGPNMFLLRLNQNTEFFIHQLNSPFCSEQLKIMAVSSAQPKLNKDNIRQLKVVSPPLEEQNDISIFITDETKKVQLTIDSAYKAIELLKEYKTALISEVVTGKVDIRNENLN
jgi:type I restriction enzyme S subunit